MKLGPRYKIARRLGADLFENTQTQKYAMRAAQAGRPKRGRGPSRSDFALQLREKQRARILYGVNERQFSRYVREAVSKRTMRDDDELFQTLESRLDNVVYRLGIASTRQASRQMAAHGHLTVNGVRITIPSYRVSVGDIIAVRKGSQSKPLFATLEDRIRDHIAPPWVRFDLVEREATIGAALQL